MWNMLKLEGKSWEEELEGW